MIQRSLLEKMQDPGSFTIPCTIGNFEFKKALCDSGTSINLMPLSMVKRLSLGELTRISQNLERYGFLVTNNHDVILMDHDEPASYQEAISSPDSDIWLESMKFEMKSMYDNKV